MPINTPQQLREHLEWAIKVELTTIPPYLYAFYSMKDKKSEAAELIMSVAIEEMLHVALASNLLISVGGQPRFYRKDLMPVYPGPLPHHVPGFIVNLEKCTREQIVKCFMAIEVPSEVEVPEDDNFESIGQFYLAIEQAFQRLDESGTLFDANEPAKQWVAGQYEKSKYIADDSGGLVLVEDLESANLALSYIVNQGEGIRHDHYADPAQQELAHYYKFEQIASGRSPIGEILPLVRNPKTSEMTSPAKEISQLFNASYCYFLTVMEELYTPTDEKGKMAYVMKIYGIMERLMGPVARCLVQIPYRNDTKENAGPTFEFYEFSDEKVQTLKELCEQASALLPGEDNLATARDYLATL